MGVWYPSKTTVKGIRGDIEHQLSHFKEIWPDHVTRVSATTKVEPFAWTGALPIPRKMQDGRRVQSLNQFTRNIEDETYELSVKVDRQMWEDQQNDQIKRRVSELPQAWGPFKDQIVADMLQAGGGTTLGAAADGLSFFHDSRTQNDSGTIDNNLTGVAAADSAIPTAAEFLDALNEVRTGLLGFKDDKGRAGTNAAAMSKLICMYHPQLHRVVTEALSATQISDTDNVFGRGLATPQENPYLAPDATPTTEIFVHAVGAEDHRGIIYQERTPLEVMVYDDPHWMDYHDGLLITLRQRFVFAYGNFRRIIRRKFTT